MLTVYPSSMSHPALIQRQWGRVRARLGFVQSIPRPLNISFGIVSAAFFNLFALPDEAQRLQVKPGFALGGPKFADQFDIDACRRNGEIVFQFLPGRISRSLIAARASR